MTTVQLELSEDVVETLRQQAAEAGIAADLYIRHIVTVFLQHTAANRSFQVKGAKLGWDLQLVAQDLFTRFVRDGQEAFALNLEIARSAEPGATPQQRAAAFEAWARFPRGDLPLLSDEALSRESIYGEQN